ncbi:MAG: helix-turn-helix transcriptional regulator [Novosphingobium sp.]|nr:helix-turn-helix transcriptional regulator [Novosphingobium sp.]
MAISAHFEESPARPGRPRPQRRTLRLEAEGALASGDAASVLVHNVSETGLLLECSTPLAVGEWMDIELPEAGATRANVIWTSGGLSGCAFEQPISAAVLSAAQLRSAVHDATGVGGSHHGSDESLGERLHRLRKDKGLTLSQIADRMGVSKPTVWAWEQDKARPIESRFGALAQVLGVPGEDLLSGRDSSAQRDVLAQCRQQIASAFGVSAEKVRILVEL